MLLSSVQHQLFFRLSSLENCFSKTTVIRVSKWSEVTQSCPTLCDPMDCSLPGFSVHGILQARVVEWVAISFSRGSSDPGIEPGSPTLQRTRDQIANIHWIIKKSREFQKNIYFCITDYAKAFDCVDHNKLENSERNGNTRPSDLPLEKSICRSGSNS